MWGMLFCFPLAHPSIHPSFPFPPIPKLLPWFHPMESAGGGGRGQISSLVETRWGLGTWAVWGWDGGFPTGGGELLGSGFVRGHVGGCTCKGEHAGFIGAPPGDRWGWGRRPDTEQQLKPVCISDEGWQVFLKHLCWSLLGSERVQYCRRREGNQSCQWLDVAAEDGNGR